VVQTGEVKRWRKVLQKCVAFDVYHLPEYHQLAEEQNDVQAILFVYENKSIVIGMPLLLRSLDGIDGIEGTGYFDATSVYGYPGPVTSETEIPQDIAEDFSISLYNYLESRGVVSSFSRLHPLIEQSSLLSNLGDMLDTGPTVVIDLRSPADEQKQQYRKGHQYDIDKARKNGIICIHDTNWDHLDTFVDIYYETMLRVDADDYYFFDRTYFTRLLDLLQEHLHLFVALKDGKAISGSLFTICNSIIQYHLSGTDSEYHDLAPSKLILDEVRMWGSKVGALFFHLGGGVGGKKDGVFQFKAGFSNQIHQFRVWCAVVNQKVYQELTEQKQAWNEQHGLEVTDTGFFPAYRARTRKKD
jgi:hypothetical protein